MKSRWIVGGGLYLEQAYQAWKQARPDEAVTKIEIPQTRDHRFDFTVFDDLNPAEDQMFVAYDERFGNFKRMEIMQKAMELGFKLEPFIHPSASIADSAVIGPNVYVGAQTVIEYGCRIEYNTVVHAGVYAGANTRIKPSCWLESGVQLGANVEIGTHCIIRMGASVHKEVKIGRGSELGWPRLYEKNVPNKTVYDIRYDEPIYTYGI